MSLRREQRLTDSLNKAQLAVSQSVVAYNLTQLGQPREAASIAQDAVKTFRQLYSQKTRQQSSLAWSLSLLSYHYIQAGENHDALSAAVESIAIYRSLATKRSSYAVELARPLLVLGLAQQNLGNPEKALSSTNEAIQLLRRSSETDLPKRLVLASALNQFSQLQVKADRYYLASTSATESVAILRELSTLTPEVLDQLSNSSTTLASLSLRQGKSAAAIPLLQEALSTEVRFLQQQLPLMPESRRQALVDTLGRRWEIPFTLAQHGEAGGSLALYTRLNRHGTLQDIERRQAIISRSTPASKSLLASLSILNGQVSNPTITAQARQNALDESERLQEELYRQLPANSLAWWKSGRWQANCPLMLFLWNFSASPLTTLPKRKRRHGANLATSPCCSIDADAPGRWIWGRRMPSIRPSLQPSIAPAYISLGPTPLGQS
jgi:tetratricopeptide (TPR) repeat protein